MGKRAKNEASKRPAARVPIPHFMFLRFWICLYPSVRPARHRPVLHPLCFVPCDSSVHHRTCVLPGVRFFRPPGTHALPSAASAAGARSSGITQFAYSDSIVSRSRIKATVSCPPLRTSSSGARSLPLYWNPIECAWAPVECMYRKKSRQHRERRGEERRGVREGETGWQQFRRWAVSEREGREWVM